MSYIYIKNKEDFQVNYPYDKSYIKSYPNIYPCIIKIKFQEGGIGGDYKSVEILEDLSDFLYHEGSLYKKC